MIRAEGLIRNYGRVAAVDNVSFQIEAGEIVGLLGHNGAGKTTIMKMISGYLEPSQGKILINDIDVWSNRQMVQNQIGYLPENSPLYPDMTVVEYLDYASDLKGIAESEKPGCICKAIEKTNLSAVAFKQISTLSRGYKQRLGVAQAILKKARILILDEPTNGLDPSQILEMRNLIRELAQNSTVIISTHILQEVEAVCSRVLIINKGKLAVDSTLGELQRTSEMRLLTDSPRGELEEILRAFPSLSISESIQRDMQFEYLIKIDDRDSAECIPEFSKALVHSSCKIRAIYPVVRDLEFVFREVSAGRHFTQEGKSSQKVEQENPQIAKEAQFEMRDTAASMA